MCAKRKRKKRLIIINLAAAWRDVADVNYAPVIFPGREYNTDKLSVLCV